MNISNVEVTAGLGGFLVLFGLALVLWFLGRDLSRRLRRMRQGEAVRRQAEDERATKSAPPTTAQPESESEEPTGEEGPSSPRE